MKQFAAAAQLDPAYPWAPFEAGKLYLKQGRDADAVSRFQEALRLAPDNFEILTLTARVLAADENPRVRDGKAAFALAARANALACGTRPLVLDALAMAYAEAGQFDDAQQAVQSALDLARAAQMTNDGPFLLRLELYKNRQPWRESFAATNAPARP